MRAFKLGILTPTGQAFSGDVTSVTLRTTDGEVGILAGHTDYLAGVDVCTVKLLDADGKPKFAFCGGGFFSVTAGEATLVADEFSFAESIDDAAVAAELEELNARLASASEKQTQQFLKTRISRAETKRRTVAAEKDK